MEINNNATTIVLTEEETEFLRIILNLILEIECI